MYSMPAHIAHLQVEKCKVQAARKGAAVTATAVTGPASAAPRNGEVTKAADDEHVAYVGNISFDSTEEEIMGLFKPHGANLLRLHRDKKTGQLKGFAHVHFPSEASLHRCMNLSSTSAPMS
jgi:nucleolin